MKCPTPQKIPFKSKVDALARATSASEWYESEMGIYRCKCRKYHLFTVTRSAPPSEPASVSAS